jgi:hypothetical protein
MGETGAEDQIARTPAPGSTSEAADSAGSDDSSTAFAGDPEGDAVSAPDRKTGHDPEPNPDVDASSSSSRGSDLDRQ